MRRTDPNRSARTGSPGYTLVELVVVMAIGGILAAFVAPRFFDQQVFAQRGYADELAAALRGTQKAAVITGCPARLTLAAASYAASQQAARGNACNPGDTTWSTAGHRRRRLGGRRTRRRPAPPRARRARSSSTTRAGSTASPGDHHHDRQPHRSRSTPTTGFVQVQ